jgi:hypothetical protein
MGGLSRTARVFAGISAIAISAVLSSVLLSGCAVTAAAESTGSPVSTQTLAETKSPAQLLRNVAASRLPLDQVTALTNSEDVSVACGEDKSIRSWMSGVIAGISVDNEPSMNGMADDLVKSFTDQGWVAKSSDSEKSHKATMTKGGSKTVILVEAVPTNTFFNEQHGAQIQISVTGPCVKTAGPDSHEVKVLEGRE